MTRIVTLGDSITLGMGDPAPGGGWRGWTRLLADGLTDPELHNLAVLGAQAKHVERDQLPAALDVKPDIASVVVGINDTLRAVGGPAAPERAGTSSDRLPVLGLAGRRGRRVAGRRGRPRARPGVRVRGQRRALVTE
jgi:lysophospholipase L1-like esterase